MGDLVPIGEAWEVLAEARSTGRAQELLRQHRGWTAPVSEERTAFGEVAVAQLAAAIPRISEETATAWASMAAREPEDIELGDWMAAAGELARAGADPSYRGWLDLARRARDRRRAPERASSAPQLEAWSQVRRVAPGDLSALVAAKADGFLSLDEYEAGCAALFRGVPLPTDIAAKVERARRRAEVIGG